MISLADGTRRGFSGVIQEIEDYDSDGALSRYRLRMVSWLWLLSQTRTSRVWQDCTIVEIVESIFNEFPAYASWQWCTGVARFLADARARRFVAMHRSALNTWQKGVVHINYADTGGEPSPMSFK